MKIVVLAGGLSTERDVSLSTGREIYRAVKKNGHKAVLVDVFMGLEDETDISDIFERDIDWGKNIGNVKEINPDTDYVRSLRKDKSSNMFGEHVLEICQMADIVFMALHGSNGEDGRIQATFDLLGVKYTGCGYVSSALAMNKDLTRNFLIARGLPMAGGFRLKKDEEVGDRLSIVGFPCIVKPCCGGSSVGVTIANNEEEFEKAAEIAFSYEDEAIVETFIKGREFSVGLIDGKALPIIEIAPLVGFYDYKNKYQAGSTIETCPAALSPELTAKMQAIAEHAYAELGMQAYARIDFLMNEDNEMFLLEANTLPGMTPTSLLPQEAAVTGLDFPALCEKLIKVSLEKYE